MKHLTDNQLITSLDNIVRREREILADVLNHFKEFDRRKLFSKLGYSSLHEYAVKHLKYSDDQAYRRVQAMRLMRDIPEIEIKIEEGALTLSSLSQAQSYFRKVEHNKEEKKEILSKLENASKKEAQKLFKQDDKVRYSFEADGTLETVIEELRGLNPHFNFDQLAKKVFTQALQFARRQKLGREPKLEKLEKRTSRISPALTKEPNAATELVDAAESRDKQLSRELTKSAVPRDSGKAIAETNLQKVATGAAVATRAVMKPRTKIIDDRVQTNSRYIPVNVKREVWFRAQGKCQNCSSTFALEYDHIVPFAKGGLSTKENLRVLCRSCNQRKAIEDYGQTKMDQFFVSEKNERYNVNEEHAA